MQKLTHSEHFAHINDKTGQPSYDDQDYLAKAAKWYGDKCGKPWEIDEETYDYFLSILPPIYGKGCFYMCEMIFDNITLRFWHEGDQYFCEYANLARKAA